LQVTINLLDANDNAPEFQSPRQITVPENSPAGASVARIQATDADVGDNGAVEYLLLGNPDGVFSLGANDGVLTVTEPLDREAVEEYVLLIRAKDRGLPEQATDFELKIKVGDENDHEPVFDPRVYESRIAEDIPVGTLLLSLEATDGDDGMNAELRYSIAAGDPNHDFYVNPRTGALSVRKRLDHERRAAYELDVAVTDLGSPSRLTDSAAVRISVRDVNDCAPVFHDAPYFAFVQENGPTGSPGSSPGSSPGPTHVTTVTATDRDTGGGGELTYSITEGDRDTFRIDPATGEITALRTLDREEKAEYKLIVQAMDKGRWLVDAL
jgi:hypothetical protein